MSEIVTDRPSGAKEHRSCAPADAAPRDLRGRKVRCLKFSTSKIRSQKLKPSSRSMFLELQHQVFCSRAPPSWWSRPSRAPARSSTCCHRSAWSVRPRHSCLRPPQPPPSRSRARSSLPTHHAHLDVGEDGRVQWLCITYRSIWMLSVAVCIARGTGSMRISALFVCSALLEARQPPLAPPCVPCLSPDRALSVHGKVVYR